MREVDEASMAIAKAVKLAKPGVIPMYPITPQTHIVERIADFINDGDLKAEMIHVESEHSAMSAAIGSSAAGSRTFTATASQGLALMFEMLHVASGMRLPIVMAVANRALSAPINIWNDHADSIACRDTGWVQLYVESAQEAHDTTVQAFKIAEATSLPVMVCLDGFTLSHVYEPCDILEQSQVDEFLPAFNPEYKLDPANPVSMGPIGYPNVFMEIKEEQQKALLGSINNIRLVHDEFAQKFGRKYGNGLLEAYKCDDAEKIIVAMGTVAGTARVVIDNRRNEGQKVGLVKLKCYRPFPENEIREVLGRVNEVAVFDRAVSYGLKLGPVCADIRNVLKCEKPVVKSYIVGLGGRDVTPDHIRYALDNIQKEEVEWLE
ncbi:pyruvate ferredoxin oxidoreductase [Candidatus Woesearchaeota archaeon]|nr:pyruvate ferredoxin oxidoreductase [Candidatus Woesearchaeota archaeon]